MLNSFVWRTIPNHIVPSSQNILNKNVATLMILTQISLLQLIKQLLELNISFLLSRQHNFSWIQDKLFPKQPFCLWKFKIIVKIFPLSISYCLISFIPILVSCGGSYLVKYCFWWLKLKGFLFWYVLIPRRSGWFSTCLWLFLKSRFFPS